VIFPIKIRRSASEGRLWLGAVAVLAVALSVWMDLSPTHRYHSGDSAVQILTSLVRWTPFFWEQNRFGMLLPLLALPVRNPYHNLLFQVGLRFLACVLSFFLLARMAVPRPYWPAVGAVSLGLFLTTRSLAHHTYLLTQPYFQAMALGLGGVLLLEREASRARIAAGVLLVALSFWISPGTLFWLLPLLLVRRAAGLETGPRRGLRVFVLLGICFAGSLAASALYGLLAYGGTDPGPARVADWPLAWRALAEGSLRYFPDGWRAALALLLATAAVLTLAGRSRGRLALAAGLCLFAAAIGEIAVLGTSGWVHRQLFDIRFLASGLTAVTVTGPALLFVLVLEGTPASWHRAANALALAALLPITLLRYGPPSPARARAALDDGLGRVSREILAGGTTHIIGDFWRVWPEVLHTDLLLYEQGSPRRVWGISYRSRPTQSLWQPKDWTRARFAILGPAAEVEGYRERFGIPPLFRKADLGRVEIDSVLPPAVPARHRAPAPPAILGPRTEPSPTLDFYTLRPCTLLDTFKEEPVVSGAPPLRIEATGACGIPSGARSLAVNIRVILPASAGWLSVSSGTVGFEGGRTVNSFQILPLSDETLTASAALEDGGDVRLILDVSGYFM
jgi:hypothetical protein